VARGRIFVSRRDGRIEIRLSEEGRSFVREQFGRLRVAEADPQHAWRSSLDQPIDPSRDDDDPLRQLERSDSVISNAELALVTVGEESLSTGEAWAWLSSLQLALRACAVTNGLVTEADVEGATSEQISDVVNLQALLFDLSAALE
jgi:hypothetical protein